MDIIRICQTTQKSTFNTYTLDFVRLCKHENKLVWVCINNSDGYAYPERTDQSFRDNFLRICRNDDDWQFIEVAAPFNQSLYILDFKEGDL